MRNAPDSVSSHLSQAEGFTSSSIARRRRGRPRRPGPLRRSLHRHIQPRQKSLVSIQEINPSSTLFQATDIDMPSRPKRSLGETSNPDKECFVSGQFLTESTHYRVINPDLVQPSLFIELKEGFATKNCDLSIITLDSLRLLGDVSFVPVREGAIVHGPRRGKFKLLGKCPIYVVFGNSPPFMIIFHVIEETSAELGVQFMLGKDDIDKYFGPYWHPLFHDQRMWELGHPPDIQNTGWMITHH